MTAFTVPLIIRGRIITQADLEFGGRRAGASFATPDVKKHLSELVLSEPSGLADLYELKFKEIEDYSQALADKLSLADNVYLQEALELSKATSGLSEAILQRIYETLGQSQFNAKLVRHMAETGVGIDYLEGWVKTELETGGRAWKRAFGARAVHIIAGNIPTVAASTVMQNFITRSDIIIKTPSNDPLTAAAIVRTMIDMAPDHPLTKHISVAYWKGGDADLEADLYKPRCIDKIIAWGGMASITHISKYIQPGIDLITLDPKLSGTIIGKEAFTDEATMRDVAERAAIDIGHRNQEACVNARVVYIQTGTDDEGLAKADRFGEMVHEALQTLPTHVSGPVEVLDMDLQGEVDALRMSDFYYVVGGGRTGTIVVSHLDEPVDFSGMLTNRVANLVPFDDISTPVRSTNASTQTVGIYPDSLRTRIRDQLSFHGAQRLTSLGYVGRPASIGPHDGLEPLRRMCKWIVEEEYRPEEAPLSSRTP